MTTSDVKKCTFNIIHFFNTPHYETAIHYLIGIKFISLTEIKNFLLLYENC